MHLFNVVSNHILLDHGKSTLADRLLEVSDFGLSTFFRTLSDAFPAHRNRDYLSERI
jgi:translation elongation factor EF-4